ncbi:hypothetical protein HXX76_014057 [Chlamydomonas incerta]|uniref:Uncharacterized protein n=1 Tax=Chlamydomonas incerta TaxID=51695 RepID=A0A835SDD7_CHLIN|nr:hypothetical protein HXX76_014057 [Chlamydomonas incerta]|eukprot:KAG2424899.1 hypothetical protein HXX76_014057 [Chlamydomonas incerta]
MAPSTPTQKPAPCRAFAVNAFNIVLLKLIKEARSHAPFKKAFDAAFRAHSSSDRFVFDKACATHPQEFAPLGRALASESEAWTLESVADKVVVVGLPVSAFMDALDPASLENYLITLACLWLIFDSPSPVQADVEALMSKLQSIENGEEVDIDDVMDDRVNQLLQRLIGNSMMDPCAGQGAADSEGGAPDLNDMLKVKPEEFMASLQDSKIASLAQEISNSINLGDDPKEVLSGGGIGSMIKTVSETINKKISDGSLNHNELLSEALGVMKSLNTSRVFKNMNLNMSALQQAARMNETRTRLREKAARRGGGGGSGGGGSAVTDDPVHQGGGGHRHRQQQPACSADFGDGPPPSRDDPFDASGRLGNDECAVLARCVQNNRIFDHCMYNNYDFYCESQQDQRVLEFGIENSRQLRGDTGPLACDVDKDSSLRRSELTQCAGRTQLVPRPFAAGPDLGRGIPAPDTESLLLQGASTLTRRACDRQESSINSFTPLLPCVENWVSQLAVADVGFSKVGMPTRDEDMQRRFLTDIGYHNDGVVWHKRVDEMVRLDQTDKIEGLLATGEYPLDWMLQDALLDGTVSMVAALIAKGASPWHNNGMGLFCAVSNREDKKVELALRVPLPSDVEDPVTAFSLDESLFKAVSNADAQTATHIIMALRGVMKPQMTRALSNIVHCTDVNSCCIAAMLVVHGAEMEGTTVVKVYASQTAAVEDNHRRALVRHGLSNNWGAGTMGSPFTAWSSCTPEQQRAYLATHPFPERRPRGHPNRQ